jgi:phage FluMu protein Com
VRDKTERGRNTADEEARCECGQLIAKLQQGGIELKCKRCKRIVVIPLASIEGWTAPSPSVRDSNKKTPATAS